MVKKINISMAGFTHYNDFLINCYYGYWHEHTLRWNKEYKNILLGIDTLNFNDWNEDYFKQFLKEIEFLKRNLKPMNLRLKIISQKDEGDQHTYTDGSQARITTRWLIYDKANKFLKDTGAVLTKSKESGKAYAQERYETEKRLLGGCIEAFIKSVKTGIPCLPDWIPDRQHERKRYKWAKSEDGNYYLKHSIAPYCKDI